MQNRGENGEKVLVEKTYEWPPPANSRAQVYVSYIEIPLGIANSYRTSKKLDLPQLHELLTSFLTLAVEN